MPRWQQTAPSGDKPSREVRRPGDGCPGASSSANIIFFLKLGGALTFLFLLVYHKSYIIKKLFLMKQVAHGPQLEQELAPNLECRSHHMLEITL